MLFSTPCCHIQHIFLWISKVTHSATKTFNSKKVESGMGVLQNHCSNNIKANLKDNSENALLCSLLWHSTYFSCGSPRKHTQLFCRIIVAITSKLIWKINLKMLFSDLCCDSQPFFFSIVAIQSSTPRNQSFKFKISWIWKWCFAEPLK